MMLFFKQILLLFQMTCFINPQTVVWIRKCSKHAQLHLQNNTEKVLKYSCTPEIVLTLKEVIALDGFMDRLFGENCTCGFTNTTFVFYVGPFLDDNKQCFRNGNKTFIRADNLKM